MKEFYRLCNALIVVFLLLSLVGPTSPPAVVAAQKVQPVLVQTALADPSKMVRVIVQRAGTATGLESHLVSLGGKVTEDLKIINAFAADIPAKVVLELSRRPDVRWVSLDAPIESAGGPDGTVNTSNMVNAYIRAINADDLWNEGYQGSSVTVAVVDSGMNKHNDFKARLVTNVKTNSYPVTTGDNYGHGTHIAGTIGGSGANSSGKYIGVAPMVKIINVKVTDDAGMALMSDVVAGLQWVYDNRVKYNIRVVNLSMNSTVVESYNVNPLDAALEILWFNKIVVVVSAGNNGTNEIYPPANDPFVISVGSINDRGTPANTDDLLASYSAFGTTPDGFSKPDLVAPGSNIISDLASSGCLLSTQYSDHRVSGASTYFRMSGTSMASAVATGAVALLLQDEPNLNPDQVKYRLMQTARPFSAGNGAGYLDIYAAVYGTSTQSANTGILASRLLSSGANPVTWGSVGWNSVGWNSVGWNSVGWNSVGWNSVGWNSDYWGP